MMTKAEDISNRPTRKGCCTKRAAALCLYLLFCQLFVQPCGDVPENLQLVGLHQQLVAGTGVEDAFMERAPFLRYSALSLRRQALQMQ